MLVANIMITWVCLKRAQLAMSLPSGCDETSQRTLNDETGSQAT